jgi:hypothetical protein
MDGVPGYEVMVVKCRHCHRKVKVTDSGNALVGMQERLRCIDCGERGADLLRVWHVGERPRADVSPINRDR